MNVSIGSPIGATPPSIGTLGPTRRKVGAGGNTAAVVGGVTGPTSTPQQIAAVAAVRQEDRDNALAEQRRNLQRAVLHFLSAVVILYLTAHEAGMLATLVLFALLRKMGWMKLLDMGLLWMASSAEGGVTREALRRADTMAQPNTTKKSEFVENKVVAVGCSSMQGWRRSMEDDHTIALEDDGGLFAVYDGHSGATIANFCGANMHNFVTMGAAYTEKDYSKALYDAFLGIDTYLYTHYSRERSGCTAVALLVKGDELICANAGDSRCILCRDGEPFPLSEDHKPSVASELTRIERAGGFVWNRRVNGALALSRAIGDFTFKGNTQIPWDQQAVTCAPEIRSVKLDYDRDEFAVLACDGIWDVMSNERVVSFVRPLLQQRVPHALICEHLMMACMSPKPLGLGCDNMSVILVEFKKPPSASSPVPPVVQTKTSVQAKAAAEEMNLAATRAAVASSVTSRERSDSKPVPAHKPDDEVADAARVERGGGQATGDRPGNTLLSTPAPEQPAAGEVVVPKSVSSPTATQPPPLSVDHPEAVTPPAEEAQAPPGTRPVATEQNRNGSGSHSSLLAPSLGCNGGSEGKAHTTLEKAVSSASSDGASCAPSEVESRGNLVDSVRNPPRDSGDCHPAPLSGSTTPE